MQKKLNEIKNVLMGHQKLQNHKFLVFTGLNSHSIIGFLHFCLLNVHFQG